MMLVYLADSRVSASWCLVRSQPQYMKTTDECTLKIKVKLKYTSPFAIHNTRVEVRGTMGT